MYANQLIAGAPGKFWVQTQNFYGERDLIGHALAWTVPARKKFKVFKAVVLSVAVDVVDGFFGVKGPSKTLLHDVAVLKNISRLAAVNSGNNESNVSVFGNAARVGTPGVLSLVTEPPVKGSAFSAAKPAVVPDVSAAVSGRKWLATLDTFDLVPKFGIFLAASRRALDRTVHRVFTEFLVVFGKVSWLVGKLVSTLTAIKGRCLDLSGGSAMYRFVLGLAGPVAKPSRHFPLSRNNENGAAILTRFLGVAGFTHRSLAGSATEALLPLRGAHVKGVSAPLTCLADRHSALLSLIRKVRDCTVRVPVSIEGAV